MFEILAKLLRSAPSGPIESLVRQVVEASVGATCERVALQIDTMTRSEARGYIRARAAAVVRKQTQIAMRAQADAPASSAAAIARMATERLVPIVLRQTGVGLLPGVSLPAAA